MKNVYFRVDSNLIIGSGHISRCFYLSEILEGMGINSTFIINEKDFFKFPNINPKVCKYISAETITQDAELTNDLIENGSTLVIDSYKHGINWEKSISKKHKMIVWDDLADREHQCDLLVDCGLLRNAVDYRGLVPASTKLLIGPQYCPLSKSFTDFSFSTKEPDRIHLFFGSSDDGSLALKFYELLQKRNSYLKFNLAFSRPLTEVANLQLKQLLRVEDRVYVGRPMAESLNSCSLAFGAPGITTWERLYLGIYSYYLANHPNQLPILVELERKGFCRLLGEINHPNLVSLLPEKLGRVVTDENSFRELIDGQGLSRIAREIIAA